MNFTKSFYKGSFCLCLVLLTLSRSVSSGSLKDLKKLPVPTVGAYHGAYADFGATEDDVSVEKIRRFELNAGKKIVWAYFSNHWIDGLIKFPWRSIKACISAGVIPYIRLSPWSAMEQNKPDPIFTMKHILTGKFDKELRDWAREAKFADYPIMIEFGPEVNGDWFPWNGRWNGGGQTRGYGDPEIPDGPERFRDAYRHLIDLFREEGADKITWILHVDANKSPDSNWNQVKYYFPGENYVDFIGVSVFGAQLPNHDWSHFPKTFKRFLNELQAASKTIPLLISEYAVIEDKNDTSAKGQWIKEALESISSGEFDRIKGVTYWNSPGWLENGSANFLIDSSVESLKSYQESLRNPFWIEQISN